MIYAGFKAVTTAGTAVPLAATSTPCAFLSVFYRTGNTGAEVRVGGGIGIGHFPSATITYPPTSIPSGTGAPLIAGSAAVIFPGNAIQQYDLSEIWIDADTSGDGVQFIYGR